MTFRHLGVLYEAIKGSIVIQGLSCSGRNWVFGGEGQTLTLGSPLESSFCVRFSLGVPWLQGRL